MQKFLSTIYPGKGVPGASKVVVVECAIEEFSFTNCLVHSVNVARLINANETGGRNKLTQVFF